MKFKLRKSSQQIKDITQTLSQIQLEKDHSLKALQAQEGNFSYYFKMYQDKVEALLKLKDDENDAWLKENAQLVARITGNNFCAPIQLLNFRGGLSFNERNNNKCFKIVC